MNHHHHQDHQLGDSTNIHHHMESHSITSSDEHQHSMSMPMMKMYFHFGLGDQVLFSNLILDSSIKLMLTSLVVFGISVILEAVKYLRTVRCQCELKPFLPRNFHPSQHSNQNGNHQQEHKACCMMVPKNGENDELSNTHCKAGLFKQKRRSYRLIQASLQLLQTTISFTLMLVIMSYNVCLIFPIVLGAGVGSFLFQRYHVNSEDHHVTCH